MSSYLFFFLFLLLACHLFSPSCYLFINNNLYIILESTVTSSVTPSPSLSLSSFSFFPPASWRCSAPGMFTALPTIPSSASLDRASVSLPGCCRCRLVRLHCCYRVLTWLQPTFKMAEQCCQAYDLQFRQIPRRQHHLLCGGLCWPGLHFPRE